MNESAADSTIRKGDVDVTFSGIGHPSVHMSRTGVGRQERVDKRIEGLPGLCLLRAWLELHPRATPTVGSGLLGSWAFLGSPGPLGSWAPGLPGLRPGGTYRTAELQVKYVPAVLPML